MKIRDEAQQITEEKVQFYKGQLILSIGENQSRILQIVQGFVAIDMQKIIPVSLGHLTLGPSYFINLFEALSKRKSLKNVRAATKCTILYISKPFFNPQILDQCAKKSLFERIQGLSSFIDDKILASELAMYAEYRQLKNDDDITNSRQQIYILKGKFIEVDKKTKKKEKKILDVTGEYFPFIFDCFTNSNGIFASSQAICITLKKAFLKIFFSQNEISMIYNSLQENARSFIQKRQRSIRALSLNIEKRTELRQIFPYPARKRYLSHWSKLKESSKRIKEENYEAYYRFKENIESRYKRCKKFGKDLREDAQNKIFKACIRKKRLRNDPLSLFDRKNCYEAAYSFKNNKELISTVKIKAPSHQRSPLCSR